MKRTNHLSWLLALLLFSGVASSVSAQTIKDVFNSSETPILYLGIDFTLAKVEDVSATSMDIRDRHYPSINELIITDTKKFDLPAAFHKSNIDHDLGIVRKRNEKINTEEIQTSNSGDYHRLTENNIIRLVNSWDFGGKKGIGLIFVVEGLSKPNKGAAVWVTLVDMATKKILMTERMEGKTGMAFGFRNYWANPMRDIIDNIEKKKYKEWRAKYGG
ncbi:MAG: hypothetical protein ABJB11_01185 [Ferruginibacter sp.]